METIEVVIEYFLFDIQFFGGCIEESDVGVLIICSWGFSISASYHGATHMFSHSWTFNGCGKLLMRPLCRGVSCFLSFGHGVWKSLVSIIWSDTRCDCFNIPSIASSFAVFEPLGVSIFLQSCNPSCSHWGSKVLSPQLIRYCVLSKLNVSVNVFLLSTSCLIWRKPHFS